MKGYNNVGYTKACLNPSYTGKRSLGPKSRASGVCHKRLNPSYTGKRSLGAAQSALPRRAGTSLNPSYTGKRSLGRSWEKPCKSTLKS